MEPSDYVVLEAIKRFGGVQGRKRLQKLLYMAKLKGAPLDDDFRFHYYGPYSTGLAARVDQLVEAKLLDEQSRSVPIGDGVEYGYRVNAAGQASLDRIDPMVPQSFRRSLTRALDAIVPLATADVLQLELASTVLYWHSKGHSWDEAVTITERRKKVERNNAAFKKAAAMAEEILGPAAAGGS